MKRMRKRQLFLKTKFSRDKTADYHIIGQYYTRLDSPSVYLSAEPKISYSDQSIICIKAVRMTARDSWMNNSATNQVTRNVDFFSFAQSNKFPNYFWHSLYIQMCSWQTLQESRTYIYGYNVFTCLFFYPRSSPSPTQSFFCIFVHNWMYLLL